MSDLSSTIVPKSDQLNADQLLSGPMTITVTSVDVKPGEQPVTIHYEGENGRPYKPGLTMRKVLVHGWGPNGEDYVGKSMTLYNDPSIKFGGMAVGGIRISHMSHIKGTINVALTSTRGKKALHHIELLEQQPSATLEDVLSAIHNASNKATMEYAKTMAMQLVNEDDVKVAQDAYKNRVSELKNKGAQSE